jgi:hypothetical protein
LSAKARAEAAATPPSGGRGNTTFRVGQSLAPEVVEEHPRPIPPEVLASGAPAAGQP